MSRLGTPLAALALALAGCEAGGAGTRISLERMILQPRVDAYEETPAFEDGRAVRVPPAGTIPRERRLGPPEVVEGVAAGRPVEQVPLAIDAELLARGSDRFAIYCAACHGPRGDGRSRVAPAMKLRQPPSLLGQRIRRLPPGAVYAVVKNGYGLMPSYAQELSVEDRWAVVAWVEVLQLASEAPLSELDALPPARQQEARRALGLGIGRDEPGGGP